MERIQWLHGQEQNKETLSSNLYTSIDPAPPSSEKDIELLKLSLVNADASLFSRYRAMFALRNQGTAEAAAALAEGWSPLTADKFQVLCVKPT